MNHKAIIVVLGEPYSIFSEIFFKIFKSNYFSSLKKPIILYVPDYEEFLIKNGFNLNIIEKEISRVAKNIDELIHLIKDANFQNKKIDNNKQMLLDEVFPKKNNGIQKILEILKS